ncbi:MAG: tyrosine-type recombinase/integrase [Sphingomonas pseudosanguinis]|uniref:tyrosine-type recombinase/integrase n=1 Tax=Sphingomonas pseudosanguinis TaxID=413712 RepID=UPI00391BB004
MPLTQKMIEKANKRRRYSDGRGLFLSVSSSGRKTWAFLYRFRDASRDTTSEDGKVKRGYLEREMNLGPAMWSRVVGTPDEKDALTLDDARDKAVELRRLVRQGVDPKAERDRETRAVVRVKRGGSTFEQVANQYIDMKKAEWDAGGASEQSWRGSLGKHVYPVIGQTAVDRIDRADILELLRPIWKPKAEGGSIVTATRLLPRLDQIFEYAIAEGLRSGANPADRHNVKKSLPDPSKVHAPKRHKALPYADVPAFIKKLQQRSGVAPRALEFTILTAMRTSEIIGATWDEIDFATGVWTIPASRMKIKRRGSGEAREPHRVPLSKPALDLLRALPRLEGNPFVFVSVQERKKGEGLSNMAMLNLFKEDMGYKGEAVVHGFRSSFKTWAAEASDYPHELSEIAIAHYPNDKTVSAYQRTDLLEKRAPMMRDWASFIYGLPTDAA